MVDPRIERFARVLTEFSLPLAPGDYFVIMAPPLAGDLVRAVYRHALRKGAHVDVHGVLPGLREIFFKEASEEQLRFVSPAERFLLEQARHLLSINAPVNLKELSNVPPERVAAANAARAELMRRFMERSATEELRWCSTVFPVPALAQEAGMSLSEYEDFVFEAGFLHLDDPVAAWQEQRRRQERLIEFLSTVRELRFLARDTDLRVGVAGRTWISAHGTHNFPDGEVYTGPVEDQVTGAIRFTYPGIYMGREVTDVRLTFQAGRVVEAKAAAGEDFLRAMLDTDEGARRVGEIALGTNYSITRFVKNTLFDEKIGGTMHLALGASYPETGGTNRSAIHWDLVCDLRDGGEVYADGKLILRNGRFVDGLW